MQQLKITPSVTVRSETVNRYLADINHYPMTSPDEETELAHRAQQGDEQAFRRLVEANLRFVVSVAKQYQGRGLDLPDLINDGNMGLMRAVRKFDPTRGFKFISYGVWWIRQSILQGIADHARMVRLPLNQIGNLGRISQVRGTFLQDNGREPTDEELAPLVGITPEKIAEAMRSLGGHLSFDSPFGEDGEGTLLDVLPDTTTEETDAPLSRESLSKDLELAFKVLPERERDILVRAFGIGCRERTLDEIGEEFHLTRERVRQLKEKAVRRLSHPSVRSLLRKHLQ